VGEFNVSNQPADTTQRNRLIRAIIGLVLAPIVGAIVSVAITFGFASFLNPIGWTSPSTFDLLFGTVSIGAAAGCPAAFILGPPIHIWLQYRRWVGVHHYIAFGALIGLITALALAVFFMQAGGAIAIIGFMIIFAGAIGGLVFWLIRRPDRDAPASAPPRAATPAHRTHGQAGDI